MAKCGMEKRNSKSQLTLGGEYRAQKLLKPKSEFRECVWEDIYDDKRKICVLLLLDTQVDDGKFNFTINSRSNFFSCLVVVGVCVCVMCVWNFVLRTQNCIASKFRNLFHFSSKRKDTHQREILNQRDRLRERERERE